MADEVNERIEKIREMVAEEKKNEELEKKRKDAEMRSRFRYEPLENYKNKEQRHEDFKILMEKIQKSLDSNDSERERMKKEDEERWKKGIYRNSSELPHEKKAVLNKVTEDFQTELKRLFEVINFKLLNS